MLPAEQNDPYSFHKTKQGQIYLGDALEVLANRIEDHSVDLIMTSPPFGLVRKKSYDNLIALANTESNSFYLRYCRERGIEPHPARYPAELPEYFIRMLTGVNDFVIDPFAGSCVTGEVCERLKRCWVCIEVYEEYVRGALGRFVRKPETEISSLKDADEPDYYYKLARPGILWNDVEGPSLPDDGGKTRPGPEIPADVSSGYSQQLASNTLWNEINEDEEAYLADEFWEQYSDSEE